VSTVGSAPALVCFSHVARTFGRGRQAVVALHDASGEVLVGDRVAIVGISGSGKSTLLHLLAGLDEPTVGTLEWPALGPRAALRPRAVGVVFQAPSLLPALDVIENVSLPSVLAGVPLATARDGARRALDRLGLVELADRLPEELSGGQAQRVAVARVLASGPSLILADEPTGQVDHATADIVVDALMHAADHAGAALVIATHDMAVADRLPGRWLMVDGRLCATRARRC
jgi:putative ABC transport system ATP-binding protein